MRLKVYLVACVLALALGIAVGLALDKAEGGICPECSTETPTGEPYATGEVPPEVTPTPTVIYVWPQRVDFDDDCVVSIFDITLQAADFLRSYPNYDGWIGELDAERMRLEDHDVDLDTYITILDLTITAQAFGLAWDCP